MKRLMLWMSLIVLLAGIIGPSATPSGVVFAQGPEVKPPEPNGLVFTGTAPEGAEVCGLDAIWPGLDGFGYVGQDISIDFVDISASGTPVSLGDDEISDAIPLGFTFSFYNSNYTDYYINSNGTLGFDGTYIDYSNDCPLPSTNNETPFVAFMWGDLDPSFGGAIYYEAFATCPTGTAIDCMITAFHGVPHYGGSSAGIFETILYGSGEIIIQYLDGGSEQGLGSTEGINGGNSGADHGLTYACDAAGSIPDGTAFWIGLPTGVMIHPPFHSADDCPGGIVPYSYTVGNYAGQTETYDVTYTSGWPVSGPATIGPLNDDDSSPLDIIVNIPNGTAPGTCDTVTIDVVGQSSGYTATAVAETCVRVGGKWQARATQPFVSMDNVVVEFGDLMYTVGGYGAAGAVGIYDPGSDSWTSGATEPSPQIAYAGDACVGLDGNGDGVIVLLNDSTSGATTLHRYNIATDSWDTPAVPAPIPANGRWAPDVISLYPITGDNICYFSGGATVPAGGDTNALYAYDPAANTAVGLGDYSYHPAGFAFHAGWYVPWIGTGGGVCVGGGVDSAGTIIADTQCYDIDAATFNAPNIDLDTMPEAIWGMADAEAVYNGEFQLWLANGVDADSDIWPHSAYYSPSSSGWDYGPDPLYGVYRVEGTALLDEFHVVAGSSGGFTPIGDHEYLHDCPSAQGIISGQVTDLETRCTDVPCVPAFVHVEPVGLDIPVNPVTSWYTASLPVASYSVTASADGYVPEGPYTAIIVTGTVFYQDFCLERPLIDVNPLTIATEAPPGVPIVETLTISNLGHQPLEFEIREIPALVLDSHETLIVGPAAIGIDPYIGEELSTSGDGKADVFIALDGVVDLSPATRMDWDARGQWVYQALQARAEASQAGVRAWLEARGIEYHAYYIDNTVLARLSGDEIAELAGLPEVVGFRGNHIYYIDVMVSGGGNPTPDAPSNLAWGIDYVDAELVWDNMGIRGEGIVVANIDTGVEWTHDALVGQFNCPGDPSNAACWEDPSNVCGGSMCDNSGHGTHTMGTMVALDDEGLTWSAGMAPGATWIACKGCESSSCSEAALNGCADWIVAPDGDPANRPHVVNNSWGGGGCDDWYLGKVQAWRAAGIYPAFSSGNPGSTCEANGSPGDYKHSFSSGAIDSDGVIASFSGLGPSCFTSEPKPNVAAPGVAVCSSVPGNGWNCGYNGTSMASPHTAGLAALIQSGKPSLVGQVEAIEYLITSTARCVDDPQCGPYESCPSPGSRGLVGYNGVYGWGIIDAYSAMQAGPAGGIPWVWEGPITGTIPGQDSIDVDVTFQCAITQAGQLLTGTLRIQHNDPCEDLIDVGLEFTCLADCFAVTIESVDVEVDGCVLSLTEHLSGTPPFGLLWDFGDGYTSTGQMPTHRYATGGSYTVTLEAENCAGAGLDQHSVVVTCCEPPDDLSSAWSPLQPGIGVVVTFTGSAIGTEPLVFDWAFGDGDTSSGATVTHTYTTTGDYVVVMVVSNTYGYEAITDTITVFTETVCVPVDIIGVMTDVWGCRIGFVPDVYGDVPIDYRWDFGDGMTSTAEMPNHAYSTPGGSFTVTLEGWNCAGDGHVVAVFPVMVACPSVYKLYLPLVSK